MVIFVKSGLAKLMIIAVKCDLQKLVVVLGEVNLVKADGYPLRRLLNCLLSL